MRRVFLGLVLALSVQSIALAQNLQARVFVNRTVAQGAVYNFYNVPVKCVIDVKGLTANTRLYIYANEILIIPPLSTGFAYAHTNIYDPFISANAYANCTWF